jgi:N-ethylmaleimide reductase
MTINAPFHALLSPTTIGHVDLRNRVVMAPMTRNRATSGTLEPTRSTATYYAQRASAGLIITEATQISAGAAGYPLTPGIHTDGQVAAWRHVTDAVHARGGRIFVQLWHTGRISHPSMQPDGSVPVAPSAIAAEGEVMTYEGPKPLLVPRALEVTEIHGIVQDFATAARRAIDAGFDGVEIHAANGYLVDQFLRDGSNRRTDAYGGSRENRAQFLRGVVEATAAAIGADRVGVRISPSGTFNSMSETEPERLTTFVAQLLEPYGLAYLHIIDPESDDTDARRPFTALARREFSGTLITNAGFTAETAEHVLESRVADLVAFGAPLLATPDFVERLQEGVPLNTPDRASFYGGDDRGYIDYPFRDGRQRLDLAAPAETV